jgi:hypothetical protein
MRCEEVLVAVLSWDNSTVAGSGLLLTDDLVLTCAHVVNVALNLPMASTAHPVRGVQVRLHVNPSEPFVATVDEGPDAWIPYNEQKPGTDLCLLHLTPKADGRPRAQLAIFRDPIDRNYRVVGFPADWKGIPDFSTGQIVGTQPGFYVLRPEPVAAAIFAGRTVPLFGHQPRPTGVIHAGFSGAPVEVEGRIIGLLGQARANVSEATAYVIPFELMPRRVADLAERREGSLSDQSPGTQTYWPAEEGRMELLTQRKTREIRPGIAKGEVLAQAHENAGYKGKGGQISGGKLLVNPTFTLVIVARLLSDI